MSRSILPVVLLSVSFYQFSTAASTYGVYAYYADSSCDGTPYGVYTWEDPACTHDDAFQCSMFAESDQMYGKCSTDYLTTMRSMFGSSPYILQVTFNDSSCSIFDQAYAVPATGNCEGSSNESTAFYVVVTLDVDGETSIQYFNDSRCSADSYMWTDYTSASMLSSHSCDGNKFQWYSSADNISSTGSASAVSNSTSDSSNGSISTTGSDNSGLSTAATVGIICGCVLLLVCIGMCIFYRRRPTRKQGKLTATLISNDTSTRGQNGLWNDDLITAKRIPRDKVKMKKLISRGANGEVYSGVFNGKQVAVKMLLSEAREDLEQVTGLLTETKMMASMHHPHIITFIGVAWDSLSDLCVVLELMDGDLRTLLNKYERSNVPVGVDRPKAIVALHVCHALTYLHSLMPPVLHRDLKSRNILLNETMEAKLTDFGASRERLRRTMTAGVGTSLWMAPEVMLGEKYDVMADMFSFGVVLSELDTHKLPYTNVKQTSDGHLMADASLLQKIATGEVQVEFSYSSPPSLVELGVACVAVDPNERPSAAEALYRLQLIISEELTS